MARVKDTLIFLLLWILGLVTGFLSVFIMLWQVFHSADAVGYGKRVLVAGDKLGASVLGFSGQYTISAQCGVATSRPWTVIRRVLDFIKSNHCENAARNEGLLK